MDRHGSTDPDLAADHAGERMLDRPGDGAPAAQPQRSGCRDRRQQQSTGDPSEYLHRP
jgi:hypothetical protein